MRLKELNEYLPYFPENGASSTRYSQPQPIHEDQLKEWLDQNLPQAYIDVAKKNLFDILGNPIEDVIEYLQTIESQLPKEKKSGTKKNNVSFSSSTASSSSNKKRKGNDSGGRAGKGKQCPHCSKLHPTPKGDYSDCFVLARNKTNQADGGDGRDPSEYKKARYNNKSYNESSYKMIEGFQEMLEKASKKGSSTKSRQRMMRAAEIIAGNSSDSSSDSSIASSEDDKSRKNRSVKKFRRYKKKR